MKKGMPALVAIVLIVVVGIAAFGTKILNKFSYSTERADLTEYFSIRKMDDVAIIMQDSMVDEKAILSNGYYYFDIDTVHTYFTERFYVDSREGLLLFTTPTQMIRCVIGENTYTVDGQVMEESYPLAFMQDETVYVAADYIKKYVNYEYKAFTDPNRMQIYTQWGDQLITHAKKDSAVRYRGGVKSEILTDVSQGQELVLLEEMETWAKVKTLDGYIGYIERKHIEAAQVVSQIPVTDYEEPEYTSLTKSEKICLGWHVIGGIGGNDTLQEVIGAAKSLNVISPTWFKLNDNQGGMTSFATKEYVDIAHSKGLSVWALIDDFSYDVDSLEILSATSNRTRIIATLMEEAKNTGIDGINVDFEDISAEAGEHFVQFLRELSIACRLNGLVLSVDNYVPYGFNDYYDRTEQGIVADYVIIMGYDEHWHGSGDPGSVASISYVSGGIERTLEEVPAEKIINAVPFYSILWKTDGTQVSDEYVIMSAMDNAVANYGLDVTWDQETCQNYGEAQSGDTLYQMWLEDADSLSAKLGVMSNYNIGGVAVWRLGYEPAGTWDLIANYMSTN